MVKYYGYNFRDGIYELQRDHPEKSLKEINNNNKVKNGYKKPLRRITLESHIFAIFDNPKEIIIRSSNKSSKYYGKIDEIDIELVYKIGDVCHITASSESNLVKAHTKALDRLIKNQ